MAIRAVVFDLGGVLEYEIETGKNTKWEARLNLMPGEYRERLFSSGLIMDATYGKISEEAMWLRYKETYGIDEAQMEEFMRDCWNQYCGELNIELVHYCEGLHARCKTAILSNAVPGARREECARFNFDKMVDLLIYSCEEGTAKPERRIYEILCERLGVRPEEIIFVDNIPEIVASAREFGIHALLFVDNAQAIAAIEALLSTNA